MRTKKNSYNLADLKHTAQVLNETVGLEPPIDTTGTKKELIDSLHVASTVLDYHGDFNYLTDLANWVLQEIGVREWRRDFPNPHTKSPVQQANEDWKETHYKRRRERLDVFNNYPSPYHLVIDYGMRYPLMQEQALKTFLYREGYALTYKDYRQAFYVLKVMRGWLREYTNYFKED